MKKPEIKKLKYPVWFRIIFYCLTVLVPIILVLIEGLTSPSKAFKITFTGICIALSAWILIRKFILKNKEEKLLNKQATLEHDYEVEIGSTDKVKWLWFTNELLLTVVNLIQVTLIGGLFILLAFGVQTAAITVKGVAFGTGILYAAAYIIKFIVILKLRGSEDPELTEENNNEVNDGTETTATNTRKS